MIAFKFKKNLDSYKQDNIVMYIEKVVIGIDLVFLIFKCFNSSKIQTNNQYRIGNTV